MKIKELARSLIISFIAILIFTLVDALFHFIVPEFSVPLWYFTNKLIYGTLIAFLSILIFKGFDLLKKSLIVSAITIVLLQIRYFYYGYPLYFHLFFIPMHFLILFATLLVLFKFLK